MCDCWTQEKKLEVQIETSFEEFMKWLHDEKQTFALDTGNIKLTYNSVSAAFVYRSVCLGLCKTVLEALCYCCMSSIRMSLCLYFTVYLLHCFCNCDCSSYMWVLFLLPLQATVAIM